MAHTVARRTGPSDKGGAQNLNHKGGVKKLSDIRMFKTFKQI